MYERFTDRARKVMQLANQEAQRFNHEYVGTEHVLLGLIKEGSGVAANVLKNIDCDLRKVRFEVEKLVQCGPDMITMGKLPQTPRTRRVIELAIAEAREMSSSYVGTEHILLGLLRETEGVAAQVLLNLKVDFEKAREEVCNLIGLPTLMPMHFSIVERVSSPSHVFATLFANGANAGNIVLHHDEFERFCDLLAAGARVRDLQTAVEIRRLATEDNEELSS
jgi:ATP-dependent Clp protease ATP-binding subunit ClpA